MDVHLWNYEGHDAPAFYFETRAQKQLVAEQHPINEMRLCQSCWMPIIDSLNPAYSVHSDSFFDWYKMMIAFLRKCCNKRYNEQIIVQLMPKSKFTNGFIDFTRASFPEYHIMFIIYGNDSVGYEDYESAEVIVLNPQCHIHDCHDVLRLLHRAKAIIVNWVDSKSILLSKLYIGKSYLLFWGGDIYRFSQEDGRRENPKVFLARKLIVNALKRARGVLTLLPSDLCQVEKVSRKHGKWMEAMIPLAVTSNGLRRNYSYRANGATRILVGNSSTKSNRHEEILKALSRFSNEDILVFAPLSYGDKSYAKVIIDLGKKLLGDKFIPLTSFMKHEAYERFLGTIDIGVFNHNRQQGMGNINLLMRGGAKVYISPDSGMWGDFSDEGRCFFSTQDICTMSFQDFVDWDEERARVNMELLDSCRQYQRAIELWKAIYEDCLR